MYNPICGIYKITNLINGHCYIGQSRHIQDVLFKSSSLFGCTNSHIIETEMGISRKWLIFYDFLIKTITAIILNKNLSSVQLRYYPPLNRVISSIGRALLLIVLKLKNSSQTITATQCQDSVEVSTL